MTSFYLKKREKKKEQTKPQKTKKGNNEDKGENQ